MLFKNFTGKREKEIPSESHLNLTGHIYFIFCIKRPCMLTKYFEISHYCDIHIIDGSKAYELGFFKISLIGNQGFLSYKGSIMIHNSYHLRTLSSTYLSSVYDNIHHFKTLDIIILSY